MITNIVAAVTVSIVTNVNTQVANFARWEPTVCNCPTRGGIFGCTLAHTVGVDPTESTITTNIVEITTLTFDWMGQKREHKQERVLYSKSVTMELKWVPSETKPPKYTPDTDINRYITLTNGGVILKP